ncbi:MAG: hypothetical protein JF615_16490 [Asticcacaulis sp.]|nr:hypothetical protein [Asticcacaulis sp.]
MLPRAYRINFGGNVAMLILGFCLAILLSPVILAYAAFVAVNRLGRRSAPLAQPSPLFFPPSH